MKNNPVHNNYVFVASEGRTMKTVLNDRAAAPQVNRSSIYGDFISFEKVAIRRLEVSFKKAALFYNALLFYK